MNKEFEWKVWKHDKHYQIRLKYKEFHYGLRVNERYKKNDKLKDTMDMLVRIVKGMEREKIKAQEIKEKLIKEVRIEKINSDNVVS